MNISFINEVILLVIAAFIGGFVARSIKLPPVVGYLVSGIIFGVLGRSFIPSYQGLFALSQIGVSLLLFTLGFEVSLDYLLKINKKVVFAGVLQILFTSIVLFPFLLLFHFGLQTSLLFSLLFSFSSTAVVLKLLEEKGMLNNFPGNNVFVMLLIQDLFIVPVIFLIPSIFNSRIPFFATILSFVFMSIKPLMAFIVMYLMSKLFLSKLLKILFRYPSQELTILATIFTAVVSISLLSSFGLPSTIAAFFAGILISDEGKNLAPLSSIRPLRDVLLVLFFVMIGMMTNGVQLFFQLPFILVVTLVILISKFIVIFLVLRFFKYLPSANIFISSHIANIGEFAVIVGQIAFMEHFITAEHYENLLSVFILSLIAIPVWIKITKKIYIKYQHTNFVKYFMGESHYFSNSAIQGIKNHVIICGHGRVGKEVRNILDMSEVPYIVLDYNKTVVDKLNESMKNALYGDPTDENVLRGAGIKYAKILVVALPDSFTQKVLIKTALHLNPDLVVLCRSHVDEDKYELVNLGVNTIVIPEFEAGLRIGKKVLELLNFNDKDTFEMLKKLRKFHLVH